MGFAERGLALVTAAGEVGLELDEIVAVERAGGHLIVTKLPPLPAGKAYEAWMLGGPAPRPAGVFTVDASGQGSRKLEPTEGVPAKAFAVTVEPEGGVPEPTGPIVLASR